MADAALGSFNPNFYGVSLIHADPGVLDHLQAYDAADDLGAWIENATSLDMAKVGQLSSIDHEVRHFHDFLASPFGLNTMGLRIQASINGIQAILAISESPGKYLPIPLSRWMGWDGGKRQAWIDGTGRPFGYDNLADFVAVPGPEHRDIAHPGGLGSVADLPLDARLGLWAGATVGAFRAMLDMRQPLSLREGYPPVSPVDAFEGSAHVTQAQAIWNGQGEAATAAYLAFLETANLACLTPYNALREALQQATPQIPNARLAELFAWSLLTQPDDLKTFGNPAFRLFLVLMLARSAPGGLLLDVPVEHLWSALDRVTGSPPWRDNLAAADVMAARRQKTYHALRDQLSGTSIDAFFHVCDLWLNDRRRLSDLLADDPGAYVNPQRYVGAPIGTFPAPFLNISFGRFLHRREKPLSPSARLKAIAADDKGRDVIAYVGVLGDRERAASVDKVIDASLMSATVDYCFFDESGGAAIDLYLEAGLKELAGKELVHLY